LNFFVVNDIHERNDLLHDLFSLNDLPSTDFVVFNGDMVNSMRSEKQMFSAFLDSAALLLGGKIPFYYARGNHETRGPFAAEYPAYFPTDNGKLYYAFSYGDAIFVVLDSGEDKPDSDMEYSGITDMDRYRSEQAEWLGELVQTDGFRSAKYKIVISHMPPFGTWHGSIDLGEKVLPLLNDAGIDIMLCGHLHTHLIQPAGTVCRFPVIVNSNENLLKVTIDSQTARFRVLNRQGKEVDRVVIKK
jgi:3',5'-cyclic AMP phosphodiesterase CpdA